MLLSDEIDKFDKHADIALRRVTRAWSSDMNDDNFTATPDMLKVEMSGGDSEPSPFSSLVFTAHTHNAYITTQWC